MFHGEANNVQGVLLFFPLFFFFLKKNLCCVLDLDEMTTQILMTSFGYGQGDSGLPSTRSFLYLVARVGVSRVTLPAGVHCTVGSLQLLAPM